MIDRIERPTVRMAKEWFYLPALALLALVVLMQRGRARKTARVA